MNSEFVQHRNKILTLYSKLPNGNKDLLESYLGDLFQFQYKYNDIYRQYCQYLGIYNSSITNIDQIPYLPISAFRNYAIKCGDFSAEEIFSSSGTTGSRKSQHHIKSLAHYLQNTTQIWESYFDHFTSYCFLALLPGYLEREGSSLISMADHFIKLSDYKESGFYLRNHEELYQKLIDNKNNNIPTVLFGVPYALLDFTEKYTLSYPSLIIIETGGMKGKREEMPKEALHHILRNKFDVLKIYSEYGMTELLSQAYTDGGTLFLPNHKMLVSTHQINDPLSVEQPGKTGILCIADAANIDSCAFIQTEDLGRVFDDSRFEISGRLDISDIRGCNLLIEEIGF